MSANSEMLRFEKQFSTGVFGIGTNIFNRGLFFVAFIFFLGSSYCFGQGISSGEKGRVGSHEDNGKPLSVMDSKASTLKDNSTLGQYLKNRLQGLDTKSSGTVKVNATPRASSIFPFEKSSRVDSVSTTALISNKSLEEEEEDPPFCQVDYVWNATDSIGDHTVSANPLGFIQGDVDVSPSGSALYSIPLWVSPGSNGMEPRLAVTYSSQAGLGLFSSRWNLNGLSAITRTSKSIFYDGEANPVTYSNDDALALDGQRLIYLGNSEYCTDPESYSRIVRQLDGSGAISGFTVYTKDGSVLEYTDAFVLKANHTISWRLSRVTDVHGNYMDYYYTTPDGYGFSGISRIEYTGNDVANVEPYNKVEFSYYAADYTNWQYIGGDSIASKRFISSIRIFHSNTLVREYSFEYADNTYSWTTDTYPRLIRIMEIGPENCLIGIKHIRWGDSGAVVTGQRNGHNFVPNTTFPSGSDPSVNHLKYFWGDFNGDGIQDFITVPRKDIYGVGDMCLFYAGTMEETYREIRRDSLNKIGAYAVVDFSQGDFNGDGP